MTLTRLQEQVRHASSLRIVGTGSKSELLPDWRGGSVSTRELAGIVCIEPDDLVFEAWGGTTIEETQFALAKHGLCLPLAEDPVLPEIVRGGGTLAGLVAMSLPHAMAAQFGPIRDWVLGMTIIRSDGTLAKCGSKVVKNVAGFDVHKTFVGSRGTLGLIARLAMRALPLSSRAEHKVQVVSDHESVRFIWRTLATDFEDCLQTCAGVAYIDNDSHTAWSSSAPDHVGEGWVIGPSGYRGGVTHSGVLEDSALAQFDPVRKFAPGWIR